MSAKADWLFVLIVTSLCLWNKINGQVSRNKNVTMSLPHYSDWSASRVVDGNYNTTANACQCCAATDTQNDPWISIDLGDTYMVTRIIVYGRTDGHVEQNLTGLFFKLDGMKMVPTQKQTEPIRSYSFILERSIPARNITLVLPGEHRLLVLCEFDVYNDRIVSTHKPVTLSSNFPDWGTPQGAVDGRITCIPHDPKYQCCAATQSQQNPWLRVNLMGYFYINYIVIQGRTDTLPIEQRLSGIEIKLDDTLINTIPNDATDYYESGAMRVGPVRSIGLNQTGLRTLVVCELTAFGECYDFYHGDCSMPCGHCLNNETCDKINGTCNKCEAGYIETDRLCNTVCPDGSYGYDCFEKCGQCRNGLPCNKQNGVCIQCKDGFQETDKKCKTLCPNGTYGYNCIEKCGYCRDGSICNQINGACNQCVDGFKETDKTCKTSCEAGTYGHSCTKVCGHCRGEEICNKTNGICNHCNDGYMETDMLCTNPCKNGTYGHNCSETCGQCRDGVSCNQTNGECGQCEDGFTEIDTKCKTACLNGTYGHDCTGTCGHCRHGGNCNKTNGVCDQCEDGYMETDMLCIDLCMNGTYGNNCTDTCGQCKDGVSCSQTNGACDHCEDGFTEIDKTCKTECPDGTHGRNCSGTCGNCRNDEICNKTNGICDNCDDGYIETDMLCLDKCDNGTYGTNCSNVCGYCGNDEVCRHSDGHCSACMEGYMYTETDDICKTEALQSTDDGGNQTGVISGAVVALVVLACIVIGSIIFIKRRRLGKKTPDHKYEQEHARVQEGSAHSNPGFEDICPDGDNNDNNDTYYNLVPKTRDVPVSQLWNYIYKNKRNDAETLKMQFKELGDHLLPTHDAMAYRHKVRYKDMSPYDHTRVHLDVEEEDECEFINASHISGFDRQNKFIASQGPMDVMVMDFWRMVWQKDVKKIVMLTNLKENGSTKCIQYWPEFGSEAYGRIQITLVKEKTTTDYVIRTLELKQDESRPKLVHQFHYKAWPDKDVPDSAWSLVMFWREVFHDDESSSAPIVVHCSAGVGRTGTFIALDNLYNQAIQTGAVNPYEIVSQLRTQRLKMVQTQGQYVYLHDAVAEALLCGTHFIWQSQFESYYNYMTRMDKGKSHTRLQKQFGIMQDGLKHSGASEGHIYSNSEINEYRPKSQAGRNYLDAIGGSIISDYAGRSSFILMASPKENQVQEFWELLDDRNIKTVVSLVDPTDSSTKRTNGHDTGTVKQFEIESAGSSLPDRVTMITVLQNIYKWHKRLSESEQIVVQCSDGVTKSGLMYVLLNEVARMLLGEGHVHVLESVTRIKQTVPGTIPNFDQYKYIHDVILDMVKKREEAVDMVTTEDACIYENVATNKL